MEFAYPVKFIYGIVLLKKTTVDLTAGHIDKGHREIKNHLLQ